MEERIITLKKIIESTDQKLFSEIIKKKVSDTELLDKEQILLNYLKQDLTTDYKIVVKINALGKIVEYWEPNSNEIFLTEKIATIASNYLIQLESPKLYLLDLSKDIYFTNERKEILTILKNISDGNQKKGYWLQGDFGVGKTHISIAFLNYLASKGKKVAFIFLPDFQNNLLNYNSGDLDRLKPMNLRLDLYKYADVLLIDDIGSEKSSEWLRNNILLPILNHREQLTKITLFTSNISIEDYSKVLRIKYNKFDELAVQRLLDRIKSLTDPIILKGKNHRHFSF